MCFHLHFVFNVFSSLFVQFLFVHFDNYSHCCETCCVHYTSTQSLSIVQFLQKWHRKTWFFLFISLLQLPSVHVNKWKKKWLAFVFWTFTCTVKTSYYKVNGFCIVDIYMYSKEKKQPSYKVTAFCDGHLHALQKTLRTKLLGQSSRFFSTELCLNRMTNISISLKQSSASGSLIISTGLQYICTL